MSDIVIGFPSVALIPVNKPALTRTNGLVWALNGAHAPDVGATSRL
jgi:hypothetical protein